MLSEVRFDPEDDNSDQDYEHGYPERGGRRIFLKGNDQIGVHPAREGPILPENQVYELEKHDWQK